MKAILVIDMPKNCYECKLRKQELFGGYFCGLNEVLGKKNHIDCLVERLNNCLLKELPQKQKPFDEFNTEYERGFNACLDEILGGNK